MRRVTRSTEIQRIAGLPRRPVWDVERATIAAEAYTRFCRRDGAHAALWPIQGAALYEIDRSGGGVMNVKVGGGKAWISLLAFEVLRAERPLLIIPASLREQTKLQVLPDARKHWRFPEPTVHAYSEMSLSKNATLLDDIAPDVIVFDEAHRVGNTKSGRTKRFLRYMRENPATKVVALSGTLLNKSLRDFAHLCEWALKARGSPLPTAWTDLQDLADALDLKVRPGHRASPGYLRKLCDEDESPVDWMRRRLVETPGFVTSWEKEQVGASLIIKRTSKKPPLKKETHDLIANTAKLWEDPNGDRITEAPQLWSILRQMSLGFWYRWDPKPPWEWMEAKQAWNRYVTHTLNNNRRGLDTPLQVWNDAEQKGNVTEQIEWAAIRDTFQINRVAEWIDEAALVAVEKWIDNNPHRGLVWVEFVEFGEKLRERGIPYFGGGKKDNRALMDHKRSAALSMNAYSEGWNLQYGWTDNLFPTFPSNGKLAEQVLARTHRFGQPMDEVTAEVWIPTPHLDASFEACRDHARWLEQQGGLRQKMNYAPVVDF